MIRGDICYYPYPEPDKRRPVEVLTRTDAIVFLNDGTVAPLTTAVRDNETSVWLDESDGCENLARSIWTGSKLS